MKKIIFSMLFLCSFTVNAASSGIRSNWTNECAIWLCGPGGFIPGCEASHSAFIGRITDVDYKGRRRYTSLPSFSNCDSGDTSGSLINPGAGTPSGGSKMTYQEVPIAIIPDHSECKKIISHNDCHGGSCYTYYSCALWEEVKGSRVRGSKCNFNVKSAIKDRSGRALTSPNSPAYCNQTKNEITVYGDGVKYGNSFEY